MGQQTPFQRLKPFRYKGNSSGVSRYLEMVNKPQGIIKDLVAQSVLRSMGFAWEEDEPAQSQYSPQGLYDGLRKYDREYTFSPNRHILEEAFNRVRSSFHGMIGKLHPYHEKVVIQTLKWQASAGAPYFRKKAQVIEDGWKYDVDKVGMDPCVAYFRTQARKGPEGWKPKIRLVWGYPLDTTVAEGKYARPIIETLMREKTPYVLGLGPMEIGSRINSIAWRPFVGSFDWSGFDSSVPPQLISLAFKIMREWFVEGSIDDVEWNKIVKYFLFTPIIMPDGKVYVGKKGGIPSGSYFTGVVGSLVNLLCIQYLTLSQGIDVYADNVLVMGDDSVVGLQQEIDVNALSLVAHKAFGMVLHPEKQRYTKYATDVEFLSHNWRHGRQSRDVEVTMAKMVYPERAWQKNLAHSNNQLRLLKAHSMMRDNPSAFRLLWELSTRFGLPWRAFPFERVAYTSKETVSGEISSYETVHTGYLSSLMYGK